MKILKIIVPKHAILNFYTLFFAVLIVAGCKKGELTTYPPDESYKGLKDSVESDFIRPFEEGKLWTLRLQPRDNQGVYNFYLMKEDGKYLMRGTGFNDVMNFEVEVKTSTDALGAILSFSEDALFTRVITALTKDRTRGSDLSYTFMKREGNVSQLEGTAYADLLTLTQIDPDSEFGKIIHSNPLALIKQQLSADFLKTPSFLAANDLVFGYFTIDVSDGKLYYFGGYDTEGKLIKGNRSLSLGGAMKDTLAFDSPIPSSNSQAVLDKLVYDPGAGHWLAAGFDATGSAIHIPITSEKMGKTSFSPWDYMSYLQTFSETQQIFLGTAIGDLFPPPLLVEKDHRSFKIAFPQKSSSANPTDQLQIFANEIRAAFPSATFNEVEFKPYGNSMIINLKTSYGFSVGPSVDVSRISKSGAGNVTHELELSYASAYEQDKKMLELNESLGLEGFSDSYRNNLKVFDALGKSFVIPGNRVILSWLDPVDEGEPQRILWTSPTDPSVRFVMEN